MMKISLPWFLLLMGGVISLFPVSPKWGEIAAYSIALGLLFLAIAFVLRRLEPGTRG